MTDDLANSLLNNERERMLVDLEFVQTLANPQYLNFLAQRNYLKNSSFINYLKYLLYFKEENYIKYIRYPQALFFLDLLQREQFRQELVNTTYCRYIEDQQLLAWQRLQRRKGHLLNSATGTTTANSETETGTAAAAAASASSATSNATLR